MIDDIRIKIGTGAGFISLEYLNKHIIIDQEDDVAEKLRKFLKSLGFTNVETYDNY